MAIFDDIIEKLKAAKNLEPGSEHLTVTSEQSKGKITLVARDFDRLGIKIDKIKVEGPRLEGSLSAVLNRQAKALSSQKTGPFKGMRSLEIDGRLGGGILRTQPDAMERGYFFEARLKDGTEIELHRTRRGEDGERVPSPFLASEETFPDMVKSLGDALRGKIDNGDAL